MSKRINVSIPDEMFAKITEFKDELTDSQIRGDKISRKISSVCQKAIQDVLLVAEASRAYRNEGIKDGEKAAGTLSEKDKKFIAKMMSGEGPYKKWSRLEKVEVLNDHFFGNKENYNFVHPRFKQLFDGEIILHDWVKVDGVPELSADRRSEMTWSYLEGCYDGIVTIITKDKKTSDTSGK